MMCGTLSPNLLAAAAGPADVVHHSMEFDLPTTPLEWTFLAGGGLLAVLFAAWLYLRDTTGMHWFWKAGLTLLRVGVFAALAIVALNPHERTQKSAFRPSRVAVLVDTTLSMRHPETTPTSDDASSQGTAIRTRAEAVHDFLSKSDFIAQLRKRHQISIFTFDQKLSGPQHFFAFDEKHNDTAPDTTTGTNVASTTQPVDEVDWAAIVEPRGLETRLGESLQELISQISGRTLSGIVVISDGASNAGIQPEAAGNLARERQLRLFTVGVGGTQEPVNLQVAQIMAPTDVQFGDPFEIVALIQGQGLARKTVQVELLKKAEQDEGPPTSLATREVMLPDQQGVSAEVRFPRTPAAPGAVTYTVRVGPVNATHDANPEDNQREHAVNVFDRATRVLLIAGGPMREYRFVRNLLYRHSSMEVDVWLQTAEAGISQEADELLFAFPERQQLFGYDVVIGFDPNWREVPAEQLQMLKDWVATEGGGLVLVAGEVHTPELAVAADELQPILDLYPVSLPPYLMDVFDDEPRNSRYSQPRQIELTDAGQVADFLNLADDPLGTQGLWKLFPGFYRSYPTHGPKAGATVFGYFPDPRSQTEYGFPILMAAQYFGEGRTLFLGSSELWRLRALDEDFYDRLWTKVIREVGQGRLKRGTKRGLLLLERQEYVLGQTVPLRARLLDPQFHPLDVASVTLEVYNPRGKPLIPAKRLIPDKNRPGEYVGDFHAGLPGTYRLELAIPDSREQAREDVVVHLPRLEDETLKQDDRLLKELSRDTGGGYFPLEEAAAGIPPLLPNAGETFTVEERLRTLWDRQWVLYLLVGMLTAEWLTRKLLKLA